MPWQHTPLVHGVRLQLQLEVLLQLCKAASQCISSLGNLCSIRRCCCSCNVPIDRLLQTIVLGRRGRVRPDSSAIARQGNPAPRQTLQFRFVGVLLSRTA